MRKLVLIPILFLVSVAIAEVVNLPGEYHYGLTFEVYNGKKVAEVEYVNFAMKGADKFCDSLGGQKRHAFFYEKEFKGNDVIVRLTDAFCSTEAREINKNADARRLIFSSRVSRGKIIGAEQRVVLERKSATYTGYKSIDAAALPGSGGRAAEIKKEEARK